MLSKVLRFAAIFGRMVDRIEAVSHSSMLDAVSTCPILFLSACLTALWLLVSTALFCVGSSECTCVWCGAEVCWANRSINLEGMVQ